MSGYFNVGGNKESLSGAFINVNGQKKRVKEIYGNVSGKKELLWTDKPRDMIIAFCMIPNEGFSGGFSYLIKPMFSYDGCEWLKGKIDVNIGIPKSWEPTTYGMSKIVRTQNAFYGFYRNYVLRSFDGKEWKLIYTHTANITDMDVFKNHVYFISGPTLNCLDTYSFNITQKSIFTSRKLIINENKIYCSYSSTLRSGFAPFEYAEFDSSSSKIDIENLVFNEPEGTFSGYESNAKVLEMIDGKIYYARTSSVNDKSSSIYSIDKNSMLVDSGYLYFSSSSFLPMKKMNSGKLLIGNGEGYFGIRENGTFRACSLRLFRSYHDTIERLKEKTIVYELTDWNSNVPSLSSQVLNFKDVTQSNISYDGLKINTNAHPIATYFKEVTE